MVVKREGIIIKDEFDRDIKVDYHLIKTSIGNKIIYGYGIKTTNITKNDVLSREFLDFTENIENAEEIFDILVENIVLPLNLINVLDDFTI